MRALSRARTYTHERTHTRTQPYVYRVNEKDVNGLLAISPQTQIIRGNMIVNFNFHGQSCGSIAIDFDDESSQYNVSGNVLLFGGQKTFDGMDRNIWDNLIVYPGNTNKMSTNACLAALQARRNVSSSHTHFFSNRCLLRQSDFPYECGAGPAPFYNHTYHVDVRSNEFLFTPAVPDGWGCGSGCWPDANCPYHTFNQWQSAGLDVGSSIAAVPTNLEVLKEIRGKLGL